MADDAPAPLSFPTIDGDWLDFLRSRADDGFAHGRAVLDTLKDGTDRSASEVLDLWNQADIALGNVLGIVSTLSEVHPDPAVRELAEKRAQEASSFLTDRDLDGELYAVLAAVDPTGLDAEATRFLTHVLRDFRRSGVDQDEGSRARLREIAERLTLLSQDFSRAVREGVGSIHVTPDRLAGLPDDFVASHQPGEDGLVELTTDYPDYVPVRTFATDADVRRDLSFEFLNRGWPDNDAVLAEIFALRHEKAQLLGYADWPTYDTEVKMIGTGDAIGEFIERISAAAASPARRDFDVLLERARIDNPSRTTLTSADALFYREIVSREQFAVDAQEVRRYFDFTRVRAGLLDVTGRLFGVEYVEVPDAARWHDEVAVYDVLVDGEHRGRIFLDLHPRAGKYKHAAQFDIARGVTGVQLPEGALICNFSRGLMEHDEVTTLFHEFGHLVHHVLGGRQTWGRFSGVATEWDFVEAPSQMLEEWAWDAGVLQSFAVDSEGTPIPTGLVERMRRAEEFGKAYLARTQMFYAALSYELHRDRPADITARVEELQARHDLFTYTEGTHFHASFGHLDGYGSGYYTYMWSMVIAKDMFSAFDADDLMGSTVAHRYRDRVLARGGSGGAADLVADFLGRPYSFDAFAAWLDD